MSFYSFPDNENNEPVQSRSVYGKVVSAASQMLHSLRSEEDELQPQPAQQSSRGHSPQVSVSDSRDNTDTPQQHPSTPELPPSRPPILRQSTISSATVGFSAEQAVPLLPTTLIPGPAINVSASSNGQKYSLPQRDGESVMSISSSASRAYLTSQYNRGRSRAVPGRLSREFWMKDESAATCFGCNRQFTTFRRKHHCRVCGQIFCSTCTRLIDGERFGTPGQRIRCCTACEDALETHSSSEEEDMSFSVNLNQFATLEDEFDSPDSSPSADETVQSSYSRVASPGAMAKDELHMARSFLGASHHHGGKHTRTRSYSQQKRDEDSNVRRKRSSSTGTLFGTPTSSPAFANTSLLGLTNPPLPPSILSSPVCGLSSPNNHPASQTATTSPATTVAAGTSAAAPTPTLASVSAAGTAAIEDYPQSTARFPQSTTVELNSASLTYLALFLNQLLRDSELPIEDWSKILTPPLLQAAAGLHLELNDSVAPREWVKVKRIPGGKADDLECMCGTVFTHALARTSMPAKLRMPRILLIAFPIEYSRHDRYMSLDPVVAQEKEYLRKLVARIKSLQPTLLLTCSHVCGQALDMLEASGVSVAQKMRVSALYHVSRIVKADILPSIDRLSTAPRLGSCELMEVRSYHYEDLVKTFMFFFVKTSDPGRCILVRGDPAMSGIVKVVTEVMIEVCYNLKAETSLMRDQFVLIPPLTNRPLQILSSSPFVDYGTPYLQQLSHKLEDEVVELGHKLDSVNKLEDQYVLSSNLDVIRRKWIDSTNQWESLERSNPYMFNPSSHQNLIVLYSLHCSKTQTPCVGPDQLLIEFYLDTDQTLGQAVENSILEVKSPCPDNCEYNLEGHYKMYINGTGCVTMYTEKSPCKLPGLQDSILMWSYCKKCEQQMPVLPMSSTTWKYSMGKYLELSFYGEPLKMRASSCEHNIYRDHIRYFGWHDYALRIEYSQVDMNEIARPPRLLLWDPSAEIQLKERVYLQLRAKMNRFWTSLIECLSKVTVEGLEEDTMQQSHRRLEKLKTQAEADREKSVKMLEQLNAETKPHDYLSLNGVLELYQQLVDNYLAEFAEFDGQFFPTERDIRRVTAQHIRGLLGDEPEKAKGIRRSSTSSESNQTKQSEKHSLAQFPENKDQGDQDATSTNGEISSPAKKESNKLSEPRLQIAPQDTNIEASDAPLSGTSAIDVSPVIASTFGSTPTKLQSRKLDFSPSTPHTSKSDNDFSQRSPSILLKSKYGNNINVSMPGLVPPDIREGAGRVSILARHFEELSRDFERERRREKQRLKDRQKSMALKQAQPVAEVFEDVSEAIEDWPQHSRSNSKSALPVDHASSLHNGPEALAETNEVDDESNRLSRQTISRANENPVESAILDVSQNTGYQPPDVSENPLVETPTADEANEAVVNDKKEVAIDDEDMKKAEPIRLSLVRALTNFWAERSSTRWNGIEYVLGASEHLFSNSLVVLRESEPSSLIAFCLSLPDYNERVAKFYSDTPGISNDQSSDTDEAVVLERAMLRQTGTHMRYHFGQNSVRVSCKIFFSEQFDALRRKCKCSERFIQSLSRCSTWDSAGGKSGSAFLKTLDDRLILKELSHAEFDSFVQFAPSYFEYMAQALFHELPTVLAKLFGVYQITIRNTQTSQQIKMYALVMENLFYGSKFNKFFDLKGSMRNRKVTETGKANEVLLDENMVEYIYDKPVFVREHSKHMLRSSLYNDTLFLTKMNVMDYSLVIGLDESNRTIVAGIIDYIRTYTWDKKIENWVKGKASTGVKEPTVVSPKQYKVRFRESMERYFVMVPDCWSQPVS